MSSTLTVSQLNRYIKSKIQGDLKLKSIYVKGEISNLREVYSSGHLYFSLKDEGALVRCVMFSRYVNPLKLIPENGMAAVVLGSIDVYEPSGTYQIIVTDILPIGEGTLNKSDELLKKKLYEKGYFSQDRKKPIPQTPKKIGVVSAPNSAALADIKSVLQRRYPLVKLYLFGTLVQGEKAPINIANAIASADSFGVDTIIIARGGGSAEDLSCFNTETVANAVYSMKTPCISAVGHETDVSIVDMIADMRAPTPSAAAELSVPDISTIYEALDRLFARLNSDISLEIDKKTKRLSELSRLLSAFSPKEKYKVSVEKLNSLTKRLDMARDNILSVKERNLSALSGSLEALSPLKVLARGYSLVCDSSGSVVTSAECLKKDDEIKINFSKGERNARII